MKRNWLVWIVALLSTTWATADVPKEEKDTAPLPAVAEQFKANPNDQEAYRAFANEYTQKIALLSRSNPAEAEKKLAELNQVLDTLNAVEGDAKLRVSQLRRTATLLKDVVELGKTPLETLEAQVDANPHDTAILTKYYRKASGEISAALQADPEKAEKLVAATRQRLEKSIDGLTNENEKKTVKSLLTSLAYSERRVEAAKKLLALIGQDAAPLQVEAWVNGESLTDADLKGKVVLLDFWAVWCGPCIATFPHLREWQDKYGDKGLVIIGITNYYKKYDFDAEKGALKAAPEPLTPEAEQEMLKRFATHHKLRHRFAVQTADSKAMEYYGVSGIPHAVIIDQAGKIRMMKVGSGEANAKALDEMLESLLSKAPATGS